MNEVSEPESRTVECAIWCILTGDEEETRLVDRPQDYLPGIREEIGPGADLDMIEELFERIQADDYDAYEEIKDILIKYEMAYSKELRERKWSLWDCWVLGDDPKDYGIDEDGEYIE